MKNSFVHIRISEKDKDDLKRIADQKQMTISELLIYLIRKEAEKEAEGEKEMKENNKYKSCRDVTPEECYIGGKHCATCMYRDNERYKDGFKKDSDTSGIYDWCSAVRKEEE